MVGFLFLPLQQNSIAGREIYIAGRGMYIAGREMHIAGREMENIGIPVKSCDWGFEKNKKNTFLRKILLSEY